VLCPHCRQKEEFNENLYPKQFRPYRKVTEHFIPKGCDVCFFTGYKGRKAVYEVIPIDFVLADKIKNGIFDITKELQERGIKTLAENAFELFEAGETSLEEIYPLLFNF
ncbi:MAG TPA: type II/IV secretion system protein, partial [Cytophagaceae bacterium]